MKTSLSKTRERGLTLVELLVVIAIIAMFAMMIYSGTARPYDKARSLRIQCLNNLKQTGLAFRIWADDHDGKFPQQLSQTNGGTMELISSLNVWRHFQMMSNELTTPRILLCPADSDRYFAATNFTTLCNSNVSFFLGVDARETNSRMLLSGDCNITNGAPVRNGILTLTIHRPAGWTSETHDKCGNVLLADDSVQQVTASSLRDIVANTGVTTNRLQMPILAP